MSWCLTEHDNTHDAQPPVPPTLARRDTDFKTRVFLPLGHGQTDTELLSLMLMHAAKASDKPGYVPLAGPSRY